MDIIISREDNSNTKISKIRTKYSIYCVFIPYILMNSLIFLVRESFTSRKEGKLNSTAYISEK